MTSKFQPRHYQAIATVIQECLDFFIETSNTEAQSGVHMVRAALADMFDRDNLAFNIERFERACVPGANVKARTR